MGRERKVKGIMGREDERERRAPLFKLQMLAGMRWNEL
jgi:hypothetical protein